MQNKAIPKSKLIQLIHIAKSQLALDDETYRAMLYNNTGKESCKTMTIGELKKVLGDLRLKGFKSTSPNQAGTLAQADDNQSKLIRHLWLSLHELGAVRNPSEIALARYVERQTGVSALQFLSTERASKVIEALKQWQQRVIKAKQHLS
ncbi:MULTISPECIES: gp16 family protein [unclassified Acinetobacter]|uniref:gp16 family protein n=1 Tax=unclassified Acinetobacter TaxID=196816 RepID=UPI0035B8A712